MIYSKLRYFKNSFFKFIICYCLFPPFPICLKVFSQLISFQQGSNVPLSPKEYTHLHCTPKTIIIQCMHYYFDGMAELQTYQHYFIHPPSTNIDLITKYAKCPILKYGINYYTQNQCASNMEDCNNPSVCFFLYQILVSGHQTVIIKLL